MLHVLTVQQMANRRREMLGDRKAATNNVRSSGPEKTYVLFVSQLLRLLIIAVSTTPS
jgi:hypothetical protein